jgi:ABC-type dipeptide/oligopeptide/nickel transport system permease component
MEKFEENKLLNERAQKLSERRQSTSQTYLTIITAIFGASAFLITDSALHYVALVLAAIPMFCIGILVCILWLNIMTKLEIFLDWQYDRLREMEKDLLGSFMILTNENKRFYEPKKNEKRFSFTLQEALLPRLLMILFGLYAIGLIVSAILGWA